MCEPKSASHCATIEGEGLPSVAGHFYSSLPAPSPPQPHMSLVLPHRTPFYGVHIVHSVFGVGAGIAVNEILCATSKALTPKYLGYDVSRDVEDWNIEERSKEEKGHNGTNQEGRVEVQGYSTSCFLQVLRPGKPCCIFTSVTG